MIWIQLIGVAALLLDIASVQFKFRKQILGMQLLASTTWVVHFFLLGAIAGSAMNAVGVIRSISYYIWRDKNRPRWVPWMIISLAIAVTALTWQGMVSLLPMTAMIIAAIAFWRQEEQMLRILLLLAIPLWFAYNILFHSYAGMASDIIALVSTAVALYRYRRQGFHTANAYSRTSSGLSKS